MSYTNIFTNKYNAVMGAITAILTTIFGIYWYFFAAFLLMNIVDWITGWYKAYRKREESSKVGSAGAIKKLGYWAVILVAFVISSCFVHAGQDLLGVNLSFLNMLGWWVLAMLTVNEARSILENLVEIGCNVPEILIKGLAVTEKLIEAGIDMQEANAAGTGAYFMKSENTKNMTLDQVISIKENVDNMTQDELAKFRNGFEEDAQGFNGEESVTDEN